MESELERILKSEKKVQATAPPGVLLFLGVTMFLLGLVSFCLSFYDPPLVPGAGPGSTSFAWVLAAFSFIAYYRAKQSRVNLVLLNTITDIRERLDQGAGKPDE
jgi:hypothetical protein